LEVIITTAITDNSLSPVMVDGPSLLIMTIGFPDPSVPYIQYQQ
jgi:hypothetical protein